jgi:hypothetical protein
MLHTEFNLLLLHPSILSISSCERLLAASHLRNAETAWLYATNLGTRNFLFRSSS